MKQLAIAVLLVLFVLSTAPPSLAVPPGTPPLDTLYDNPGIDDGSTLFDNFTHTLIIAGEPKNSVLADLNSDGLEDIAVIYEGSNRLDIFFCDRANGFSNANMTSVTLLYNITDIAIGDMDLNGMNDVVLVLDIKSQNNLVVLYQSSGFQLSSAFKMQTMYLPLAVAVGNFTGTARPEVALVTHGVLPGTPQFMIFQWSTNTYELWTPLIQLSGAPLKMVEPRMIAVGYLNQDDLNDLVIGDSISGRVAGYLNPGNASWGAQTYIPRNGPSDLFLSDIDGNGALELVVSEVGEESPQLTIWNYSSSGFIPIANIDTSSVLGSIDAFSLNEDLRLEIAAVSDDNNDLTLFKASSSGTLSYPNSTRSPVLRRPVSVAAADLNLDGEDDIVVISCPSDGFGAITIYYQSGDAISNANDNQFLDGWPTSLATVGDMDGDGAGELVTYDTSGLVRLSREGFPILRQLPAPTNVTAIECLDLNGDGSDELVMISSAPRNVTIWYGDPDFLDNTYTITSTILEYSMDPALTIAAGDLDGDGDNDLAIGGNGKVDIFWNSGTGAPFSQGQRSTLSLSGAMITSMACIRIQGSSHNDDLIDLAVVNASASRIEIYFQQTAGEKFISGSRLLLDNRSGIGGLIASDLSGDGKDDLLTSTPLALHLYVQSSGYTQGFLNGQPVEGLPVTERVRSFELGDLDDDGRPEIALLTSNSTLEAHEFDGAGFIQLTRQTAGASPSFLALADMDGDRKQDITTYSSLSRALSIHYQNNFAPVAVGSVDGTGHLEGDEITFNATLSTDSFSDRERLSYTWDFGDGTVVTVETNITTYPYQKNGMFNVELTVRDPDGLSDWTSFQVTVADKAPLAALTYEGTTHYQGDPVQFRDLSFSLPDNITQWYWDFGDGNTSEIMDPVHIYGADGNFTVSLTVWDSDNSSDTANISIAILDTDPLADFTYLPSSPLEGETVAFTDLSLHGADGITLWCWDFGDGHWTNVTSGGSVQHTYTYNGTYYVTLTVVDGDGDESSVTDQVLVRNSVPSAGFFLSIPSPYEGQQLSFNENSTSTNALVKWNWDLGDGTLVERSTNDPVVHTYGDNGTYYVKLTVTDVDGDVNAFIRTIVVRDTSPVVSKLYTVGGGSSFKEWDELVFEVLALEQWDGIVRYQWSFETLAFQAAAETDFNSTSHRYNSSGTYRVAVRVWDSDSYTESGIQITITDPAPVPDFTFAANTGNRTVSFSAALTHDTENEILEYRWFFGDNQQTIWSVDDSVNHTYALDGIYSVRLEVRDGNNPTVMKTRNVTIDLLPPVISMDDPVLKAIVGEPTLIKVNVTDLVGIGSVVLEYTIGNVTKTVAMTHEGGGIYFAQIPAQNRTMELTYRIVAEDMAGHSASTEEFTLALEYEDPSLFIYTSLALLIALLVIILYLFLSRPIVDEVFVMYHDGTLLAHQTRRLKPGMDDDILGGMLIALQKFVRDSFKDENSTVLRRMDFGERKLLVERKDDFFMAVVLSGKRAGNAAQRMLKVLDNIEDGYAPVLKEWDGDLEKVRGIRDETKPMFSRANPLDRLKRKEGEDDSI